MNFPAEKKRKESKTKKPSHLVLGQQRQEGGKGRRSFGFQNPHERERSEEKSRGLPPSEARSLQPGGGLEEGRKMGCVFLSPEESLLEQCV